VFRYWHFTLIYINILYLYFIYYFVWLYACASMCSVHILFFFICIKNIKQKKYNLINIWNAFLINLVFLGLHLFLMKTGSQNSVKYTITDWKKNKYLMNLRCTFCVSLYSLSIRPALLHVSLLQLLQSRLQLHRVCTRPLRLDPALLTHTHTHTHAHTHTDTRMHTRTHSQTDTHTHPHTQIFDRIQR